MGEKYRPKKVITYYFSPLCHNCLAFKDQIREKDTLVIFQPVLMDDHDVQKQVFILSLIKKFRLDDFWEYAQKFHDIESQHLSFEETAQKMGFHESEIQWVKEHEDYQKAIKEELRNPVEAKIQKRKVIYQTIPDSHIAYVPFLKEPS